MENEGADTVGLLTLHSLHFCEPWVIPQRRNPDSPPSGNAAIT